MNIQIWGSTKCFDTKKAVRYFKERGVKFQLIDIKEKGLSKGEYKNIKNIIGRDNMINKNYKDKGLLSLIEHLVEEDKDEKILENQQILITPIVRNGKYACVGYKPEIWKNWE